MKLGKLFRKSTHMKYCYSYYYEHLPVDDKAVLLESFHGKTINDSPLAIAKEIERLYPGQYKLYFATNAAANGSENHAALLEEAGVHAELLEISSLEYNKILATAGYIISNASLPIYFIRREGQKYLQTWHGTPLKTLGKQMREGIESMYNVQHNFVQATHLLFPNDFTREAIMRDYNLEKLFTGKIIMCGYPRNEVFFRTEEADEIRRRNQLEGKTVYAYMPTWRGTSNSSIESTSYYEEVHGVFQRLDSMLTDDQVMYVNFHPIIGGKFSFREYSHIKPFPAGVDTYAFLNAADILVTDYSSVFFDYAITRKPTVLFMYDYDKYMADRGMYMDIRTLPFRKVYDVDEFCEGIAGNRYLPDTLADPDFEKRFLGYDSPGCTEKLLRTFFEGEETGLTTLDYSTNKEKHFRVIAPDDIASETDLEAIKTIVDAENESKSEDEEDIVLMYRKWFKDGIGQILHDKYNDSFNYVITTSGPPRTYSTQILKMLGSRKAAEKIHFNDVRRCFGDLNVDTRFIKYRSLSKAELIKCSCEKGGVTITALIRGCRSSLVKYAELRLDNNSKELVIRPGLSCSDTHEGCKVVIRIGSKEMSEMMPLRWSCNLIIDKYGEEKTVPVYNTKRLTRAALKIKDTGTRTADGYILYPYIDKGGIIKFCYRKISEYDTGAIRVREITAMILYVLFGRILRRKKHYIIYEKFSRTAQDNSYYFFRYCMDKLPAGEKRRFYYVIDKKSPEYANVKKYGRHVIDFMSLRHMLLTMSARLLISTDAVPHAYAWQTRPSLVYSRIRKKNVFFLQHGVTALKKVDGQFGVSGQTPMKYFVATSETERDIIIREFGYDESRVPITGFARWDALEDKRDPDNRFILFMPTWRSWLEDFRDEDFMASEYYRHYFDLLTSPELDRLLKEFDLGAVLYMHPRFAGYIETFIGRLPENIELISFGEKPLNELMMRAEMLITDYSSVCWDMFYMDKPVVFYQFDIDQYLREHGSYIDLRTELPGPRAEDQEHLLAAVRSYAEGDFVIEEEYEDRLQRFFISRDKNNCERTYRFLKEKE